MNEKLNIQNLTDEFAESYGINRKDAEAFIKEFFSVIQEGLEKDKYVKIKGFGTFKIIEVDSRESINVNTGERFEIQGHSKITFTPDNNIKEAVNKPFSAFQTVVLADGVAIDAPEENLIDALSDEIKEEEPAVIEAEPQVEAASAEPKIEPVSKEDFVSEEGTAEEESNAIEAPQAEAEPIDEPAASVEPVVEEVPAVEEPVAEEPAPTEPSEEDEVQEAVTEEPVTESEAPQAEAEQPADATILSIFDDDAIKKKDQPVSHQEEVMALKLTEEKRKEISRKADRSATPYLMFLAVLTIMICLGIVAYIYYPDLANNDAKPITPLSSEINTQQPEAESTIEAPVETTQPDVAPDSVAVPAAEAQTQSEEPVKKEVTAPITVREESVPKAETQPATPAATQPTTPAATQPTTSAAEQPKTTTKPAASAATQAAKPATQTTKSATTLKVGKNEYVVEGEIETHVLSKGETLFSLSRKYYGNNAMYACIIEYNKDVIKNPDNIPEGTKLRIPKLVKK